MEDKITVVVLEGRLAPPALCPVEPRVCLRVCKVVPELSTQCHTLRLGVSTSRKGAGGWLVMCRGVVSGALRGG